MTSVVGVAKEIFATPFVLLGAALVGLAATELVFRLTLLLGGRWFDRTIASSIARRCWWPARVLIPTVAVELVLPMSDLTPWQNNLVQHLLTLIVIVAAAWTIVALISALEDAALHRFRIDVQDNLRARRVRTRLNVFRRITVVVVSTLAVGAMLTTFESARTLGTSLLFSAGIAGIVIGIAARPTISNLIAGAQIFFAEPFRIDDVVVVEGEWGRIQEITLTYVLVRTWDERSLVVPLTYFLEHKFENWTLGSVHLLATVYIALDFSVSVQRLRDELGKILHESPLWDRRTWNLQVTELGHDSVELRALMTARDATTAWDLRCEVREKLLTFLQGRPGTLPRRRVGVVENGVSSLSSVG